jgi:hypothetical protein
LDERGNRFTRRLRLDRERVTAVTDPSDHHEGNRDAPDHVARLDTAEKEKHWRSPFGTPGIENATTATADDGQGGDAVVMIDPFDTRTAGCTMGRSPQTVQLEFIVGGTRMLMA